MRCSAHRPSPDYDREIRQFMQAYGLQPILNAIAVSKDFLHGHDGLSADSKRWSLWEMDASAHDAWSKGLVTLRHAITPDTLAIPTGLMGVLCDRGSMGQEPMVAIHGPGKVTERLEQIEREFWGSAAEARAFGLSMGSPVPGDAMRVPAGDDYGVYALVGVGSGKAHIELRRFGDGWMHRGYGERASIPLEEFAIRSGFAKSPRVAV
jgi:hypothetical protein